MSYRAEWYRKTISKCRQAFGMQGSMSRDRSAQAKSEYPFETRPIHPSSRAGIPGPAAAPDMRGLGIYVAAGDVGFNLVTMNACTRAARD